MKTDNVRPQIHDWILENFPLAREKQISGNDSLLDSGIVDSIGTLEIVMFVEQNFGLEFTEEDMVPENFASINAISGFVERRAAG